MSSATNLLGALKVKIFALFFPENRAWHIFRIFTYFLWKVRNLLFLLFTDFPFIVSKEY